MKMEPEKRKRTATCANIDSSEHVLDRISHLCMSENYSDVVFLVNDQRLPAHKCILAAANTYFKILLYGNFSESYQKEIKLEVPLEAFKAILRYIYSGKICLVDMEEKIVLDLLRLANAYEFPPLELGVIRYLTEKMDINNILAFFEIAWKCELSDLKEACYTFMTMNASKLLAHESFTDLSKESLQDIIRRDSFLAPEFEIYRAVIAWHKKNPDADIHSVLSNVRFLLMTISELSTIRRMGIVKVETLMDAIELRNVLSNFPYRVLLGENMFELKYGSKLITGNLLSNNLGGINFIAKQECCSIVVELGITSVINHIAFQLVGNEFSYFLEVSTNRLQWERIVDYRYFICQHLQILYFPPKYIKYIKLVDMNKYVTICALKATYVETIPKQINGIIAAAIEIYGITQEGNVKQKTGIFDTISYDRTMKVDVQLNQPYLVGAIRLFLFPPFPPFNITCKISTNRQSWTIIACQKQDIVFQPCEANFIEISSTCSCFTKSTSHKIHFAL